MACWQFLLQNYQWLYYSRFSLFDHLVKELLPQLYKPENGGYNRLLYPYFLYPVGTNILNSSKTANLASELTASQQSVHSCQSLQGRILQKGGVPAAPSGTATLLRLSPSHRFYPYSGGKPLLQVCPTPMA